MRGRNEVASIVRRITSASGTCAHHCHDSGKLANPLVRYSTKPGAQPGDIGDYAFEMVHSTVRFGAGVTGELGMDLANLGAKKTLLLTDPGVHQLHAFRAAADSLTKSGLDFEVFADVSVEPTDQSFWAAAEKAKTIGADAFVAVGGGSTMDTAKAAALYAANPEAEFLDFVTPPYGLGKSPGPKRLPLIAVPTTAGTGSEATTVAVFDFLGKGIKSAIRHRALKPYLAIVDPLNVASMPREVAIYSGFDVLCHALESYTARPFTQRSPRPKDPALRPVYQNGAEDTEAQSRMLLASTFAGMGFGNAGVHLCHGLSYPISGQGKKYTSAGYPDNKPLIPHGLSVVTTACEDFKFTASADPGRHLDAASHLGYDTQSVNEEQAGGILSDLIAGYMRDFQVPNGLSDMGFKRSDVGSLTSAAVSSGSLKLSPKEEAETLAAVEGIYERSLNIY